MLIAGAGGFAKEVLETFMELKTTDRIVFYDDFNLDAPDLLFNKFTVLRSKNDVIDFFNKGNRQFVLGIGNSINREKLTKLFSSSVTIGIGCIVYFNAIICHDCEIGDYVEISPNATVLGKCKIGSFTQIGSNATILPGIEIGENVIIGAGAIVTKNVSNNCVVIGNPGEVINLNK
jgi:acetyltransferase-like isoleucine patch superfamily enzyme